MLRFLRRVLSSNSPFVLAPEAQVAARARAPVRRHPSGISARGKRRKHTGLVFEQPGHPLLFCAGPVAASPGRARGVSPLQPRRLGCTPLRSARVPCGTIRADATGHQLALRSEASKSRYAPPERPFGASRFKSPLGGGWHRPRVLLCFDKHSITGINPLAQGRSAWANVRRQLTPVVSEVDDGRVSVSYPV